MFARKDIPTVLPDAVLRCRKLQAAANIELLDMEKAKFRRINNLDWQRQTFHRTVTERHKRWRIYDRAFRQQLKRELGADLAAAVRLRMEQDKEDRERLEQSFIDQSSSSKKLDINPPVTKLPKSTSAKPKSEKPKTATTRGLRSAATAPTYRVPSAATTIASHATSVASGSNKLLVKRPRTSRFDTQTIKKDDDLNIPSINDFGSVLIRMLSNIAATPDLEDDETIKRRAIEARERRAAQSRDRRYFDLLEKLSSQKLTNDDSDENNESERQN